MVIWFWYKVIPSFCCSNFNICFLTFSVVFPKTALFMNLKKSFSKPSFCFFLRSVFISIYGFSQAFWLNVITLWTLVKSNPWLNACFKFLMCLTYSVLSCKLAQAFRVFQFSFLVKMVNNYQVHVIFQYIEHHLQENILYSFLDPCL